MTKEARDEAIKRLIEEYTTAVTQSQQAAKAALIREGIYTESGELKPQYRDQQAA